MTNEQLNPEQAEAVLHGLHNEVFFNKLAELGINPQNEEEAISMLKIAFDLEAKGAVPSQTETKQANFYASAYDALSGLGQEEEPVTAEKVASVLANDPVYLQSALIALASEAANQEE